MKLKCSKCQTDIAITPEVLQALEPRVECPNCRALYRLKPRTGVQPANVATASELQVRTTPSLPFPETRAAPRPTNEGDPTVVSTGGSSTRPRWAGGPVFAPGDLVARRYQIRVFLAQGGMGEVYHAEDLELRQQVALKTISAHLGAESLAIERFKREIALARLVTHPNVCRIFDLGQHFLPGVDGELPITFLTMELLAGETMTQVLRRRGRLGVEEALPLIEQMAAALDAAHHAQVVHRDFKSENVFLVPLANTPAVANARFRVVVTDFGVARGAESSDRFAAQVTGLGIVGTPAYMAPEQVENKEITSAADLYALGIVIYEMVTGKLPFESPNPLTTAVKRLKEAPPPPHVHVPDLPAWWERAILKCLERRPEDRFTSGAELVEALQRKGRSAESRTGAVALPRASGDQRSPALPHSTRIAIQQAPPTPAKKRARLLIATLAAVILISSGLLLFNRFRQQDPGRIQLRRSVAVFDLKNLAGQAEKDWISTAAAEMISSELARGGQLRTISTTAIAEAKRQIRNPAGAELDREQLRLLRSQLGCDFVVTGSFLSLTSAADQPDFRFDVRIQDAVLGSSTANLSEQGRSGDLIALVGKLGASLRKSLGADDQVDEASTGQPRDEEAARHYASALEAMRLFQPEVAKDHLLKAIQKESDNPLLHSALASVWQTLGFSKEASSSARRAFELSSNLNGEDRLVVEAKLREIEGDWAAARELYTTLATTYPDDLDYGLALVASLNAAGQADQALHAVDRLRRLPPPLSDDPRIDLAEVESAGKAGLLSRQAVAAERAARKAESLGAQWQLGRALLTQAQVERLLGKADGAERVATRALGIFEELQHRLGAAEAQIALGTIRLDLGRYDESAAAFAKAAEIYRGIGDQGGLAASLSNLAVSHRRLGDLGKAESLYLETEEICRKIGDRHGQARAINNRAVVLTDRDRLAEALRMFEGSRPVWLEISGPIGESYVLNNIAEVQRLQGKLAEAQKNHEAALTTRRSAGLKPDMATSLANLAGLALERGDTDSAEHWLDEAEKLALEVNDRSLQALVAFQRGELLFLRGSLEEAALAHRRGLDLRRELREATRLPQSQIALARVELEADRPEEAVELAQEALGSFRRDQRIADEMRATALLARIWARLGLASQSTAALAAGLKLYDLTEQPLARLQLDLTHARLLQRSADREALELLSNGSATAARIGLIPMKLELELAWCERQKNRAEVKARLDEIRREATELGLMIFEDKATRLGA